MWVPRCGSRRWEGRGLSSRRISFGCVRSFFSGYKQNWQYLVIDFSEVLWGGQINCKIVLDILQKTAVVTHDSPKAQTCTFDGPGLHKFHETTPSEEERMKRGKKKRIWAIRRKGVPRRGGGVGGGDSGQHPKFGRTQKILNTHRTDTPHHTTPHHNTTQQRHTTQHNGGSRTGWSWAGGPVHGGSMAQKTRPEQQIVPKSSPIGQGFLGSRMVRKGLGTKRFDQKKKEQKAVWANSGAGQKWSEKPKNGKKNK